MAAISRDDSEDESDMESEFSTLSEASSAGEESSSKVYFKSKPFFTKTCITKHFAKHGFDDSVTKITMFHDSATHKPKGCGYVSFTSEKHAQEAFKKLNGSYLRGNHRLVVKPYKFKQNPSEKKKATGAVSPCKRTRQPKAHSTRKGKTVNISTPQGESQPLSDSTPWGKKPCNLKGKTLQSSSQASSVSESQCVLVPEVHDSSTTSIDIYISIDVVHVMYIYIDTHAKSESRLNYMAL